jgi:hypothetical protein
MGVTASSVNKPSSLIYLALLFLLIASAGISVVVGRGGEEQMFAAFGAAKQILLPTGYVAFAAVVLWTLTHPATITVLPLWWQAIVIIGVLSTMLSAFYSRQNVGIGNLLEGAALILGWALIALAGLRVPDWSNQMQWRMLLLLGIAAVFSTLIGARLGAFVSFNVPVTAALIYASARLKRRRLILLPLGIFMLASTAYSAIVGGAVSAALISQCIACSFLLIVALLPAFLRIIVSVLGLVAGIYVLFSRGIFDLMLGDPAPGIGDVTLTHRAYEAASVEKLINESFVSWLFGAGPAATVNLSGSPDVLTLLAAGRNITAVDDVHFLTSWILLKLGIFGLAWLMFFGIVLCYELVRVLNMPRPRTFEITLLFFVIGGVVAALPAATNFFANPLIPLFFGILVAKRRLESSCTRTDKNISVPERGHLTMR